MRYTQNGMQEAQARSQPINLLLPLPKGEDAKAGRAKWERSRSLFMPLAHSAIATSVNIIEGETTLTPPSTVKRSRSKALRSTRTQPNLLVKQKKSVAAGQLLRSPRYPAMDKLVPCKNSQVKTYFPIRNCKTNIWLLTHRTSLGRLNKSLDPVSSSGQEVPKVWNSNCANCTLYKFHSFSAQVSETTLNFHNLLTFGSETIAQAASLYAKRAGDWHRVPFRICSQFHSKPGFQESMKAPRAQNSLLQMNLENSAATQEGDQCHPILGDVCRGLVGYVL